LPGPFDIDTRQGRAALAACKQASVRAGAITAETQKTLLGAEGARLGYLDLVLTVRDTKAAGSTIWVEVKADAWACVPNSPRGAEKLRRPSKNPRPGRPEEAPRWRTHSPDADLNPNTAPTRQPLRPRY